MSQRQMLEQKGIDASDVGDGRNIFNQNYVDPLTEKWDQFLGHVDGGSMQDKHRRKVTAMVLENTVRDSKKATNKNSSLIQEADSSQTATGAIADYASTIFPVLLRVFPNLIAHELVSIQPMSGPVGAVFFMEYKHGTAKGTVNKGDNLIETFDESYSSEHVVDELLATGNGTDYGGGGSPLTTELDFAPVFPNNDSVADPDHKVVVREVDANGNTVQEATDDGNNGFTGDVNAGSIDYVTGHLSGFLFSSAVQNGNNILVDYWYDMESNQRVPDVSLDISIQEIRAQTRKLNIKWSSEAADDLRALHGVEGEAQLLAGVSNQIGLEIDREILNDIREGADTVDTFNLGSAPSGLSQLDFLRELITKIHQVSNQIFKKSKRSQANWMVTSPEVSALLMQFQGHGDYTMLGPKTDREPSYGDLTSDYGIYELGLLMNRLRVYVDPFFKSNEALLGIKGRNYLDAGYVYAPYVPLQVTQTFLDPEDQTYKKGLRTRYATNYLRPRHYGRVKVLGL